MNIKKIIKEEIDNFDWTDGIESAIDLTLNIGDTFKISSNEVSFTIIKITDKHILLDVFNIEGSLVTQSETSIELFQSIVESGKYIRVNN
jgi:hypothetical protein